MSFLKIQNLVKSFGKTAIFENINLSIEKGEFLVLLGPSGCGKSTLLNCIAGLISFDDGNIIIADKNMNAVHPSQRDIAMVFQSYALYPNMTVRKNISFGMKIRKKNKTEIAGKIKEVSDILQITEILDRKPSQLSGGQQQRVAIGRALVRDPLLFLFDEPLSNLDAKLRVKMRTEIKRLHLKLKTTIIYVTHDQVEAMSLADKIAVMNNGKIVQFGTPNEIYFKPANTFVAEFIGSPPMNMIPVTLTQKSSNLEITLKQAKKNIHIPLPQNLIKQNPKLLEQLRLMINQEILLGIRPENIYYKTSNPKLKKWQVAFMVDFIEPNGADNLIILSLNGKEVICRLHSDSALPKISTSHYFNLDLERALFYHPDSGNQIH